MCVVPAVPRLVCVAAFYSGVAFLRQCVCHSDREEERFQCCDGLSWRHASVYSHPGRQVVVGVISAVDDGVLPTRLFAFLNGKVQLMSSTVTV